MKEASIVVHPTVADSLAKGKPVVALESTIITHGMPFPQNLETANLLEKDVRDEGGVPATIAVVKGQIKVGLSAQDLEYLASASGLQKISRRDLPVAVAALRSGGTTVSATMIAAHLAGLKIFATGGIGGVHRGGEITMDISADLQELARTPVAVVSAGAKAILDLPKTLEYLETMGVPVIGFQTPNFPGFYTRETGLKVSFEASSPEEVAKILHAKWELGLGGGVLIANPIPQEDALDPGTVDTWISHALVTAATRGIRGAAVTPFLLAELERLTFGKSLAANVSLVRNNARLATRIAKVFASL